MIFSDNELVRYSRQIVLREIGGTGQVRLADASVTIVGAGGIGVPVLQYLAAAGVGRITVIDDDAVDASNLQRQVIYTESDVGRSKAATATARAAAINPHIAVSALPMRIIAENAHALLRGADVIVDGTDTFATRLIVADASWALQVPLVSAAIGQFHAQLGVWQGWEADLPCYRCYVGDAFDADDCDTCAEQGVLGAMTGWVGSMAALEAIRVLYPFGERQAGKLHVIDGLAPAMRTIRMPKDPHCATCGTSVSDRPSTAS